MTKRITLGPVPKLELNRKTLHSILNFPADGTSSISSCSLLKMSAERMGYTDVTVTNNTSSDLTTTTLVATPPEQLVLSTGTEYTGTVIEITHIGLCQWLYDQENITDVVAVTELAVIFNNTMSLTATALSAEYMHTLAKQLDATPANVVLAVSLLTKIYNSTEHDSPELPLSQVLHYSDGILTITTIIKRPE